MPLPVSIRSTVDLALSTLRHFRRAPLRPTRP
jgi:hypothetical protein